jgi:DNA replication protein DnaC
MREQLHELLAKLRLRGIERALDGELDRAEREGSSSAEVIGRLLAEEEAHRREKSLAYRLTQAKLPWNCGTGRSTLFPSIASLESTAPRSAPWRDWTSCAETRI